MTKLLQRAITQLRDMPVETQDLAAGALFIVIDQVNDDTHYQLRDGRDSTLIVIGRQIYLWYG